MAQPGFVSSGPHLPDPAGSPERLGRFVLGPVLGRGANGVVYAATDTRQGHTVALKVLTPPPGLTPARRQDLADRFAREARAVAQLRHPAIVTLTEFGQAEDGRQYLVMERLEGETLRARLERWGPLLVSEALPLLTQIADALQYAHGRGIVHRDVKPDNVFVCADGTAKLMDFGVARVYADDGMTHAGTVVGSPAYMSPEQIGGGAVDGRSDVFSLAVTLAEAVTGRRPFAGDDIPSVMYHILHRPPQIGGVGSRPLRRALERALAKAPAARTASAGALASALRQAAPPSAFMGPGAGAALLTTQVLARPDLAPPDPLWAARRGLAGAGIALALVALVAVPLSLHSHPIPAGALPVTPAARVAAAGHAAAIEAARRLAAAAAQDDGQGLIVETTPQDVPAPKPARKDAALLRALRDETLVPGAAVPDDVPPPLPQAVTRPASYVSRPARPRAVARPAARVAAGAAPDAPRTIPGDAVLYGMAGTDEAPHLVHHTDPVTPSGAAGAGTVGLLVSINREGDVSDARVTQSAGDRSLDAAAVATVLHWRYAPATHDGHAVAANIAEQVAFSR